MPKRYRNIEVNGILYGWTLKNGGDGDGGNFIQIWRNKKPIYEENMCGNIDVTHKLISEKIKNICQNQEQEKQLQKKMS